MIIILMLLIAIGLFIIAKFTPEDSILEIVSLITGATLCLVSVCLAIYCIAIHTPTIRKGCLISYEQTYNSITNVIGNNNDNDNVILLTDKIAEYNTSVLNGRIQQDNFWLKPLTYDFWYDLPLIEL